MTDEDLKGALARDWDVCIVGAGGAGMMCAIQAAQRGRRVLVIDHAKTIGQKILISGGGRCNFTNIGASARNYVSKNPHFCKSALTRFPPEAFIELVRAHGISFHEKKLGQLFCDVSAKAIVDLLTAECAQAGAQIELDCRVESIAQNPPQNGPRFKLQTSKGELECESLVIATGGLSFPKLGATGFGYEIARQFGLKVVEPVPALDGFTFQPGEERLFRELAGASVEVEIACNGIPFRENILFTHTGLSGPAALQASLHWNKGDEITINLLPDLDSFEWFLKKKREGNRGIVRNLLSELLPSRLASRLCDLYFPSTLPLPQVSERELANFCAHLHKWTLRPAGTVGFHKAEVTRGGVDTAELSSKTLEARSVPGLYFVGEVVDVTGWLGGYNFQWVWASGWAAGQAV